MKSIKVLGSGCKTCVNTAKLIEDKARALGVAIEIEKVTDMAAIASHGVMRTPGVVVDGTVVHAGGMPQPDAVEAWLKG
ncbi:thioredoxin family protein [Pararhodospirillum oryzae]|uniref:Glutaredoxin n=1 Tax=Pararhodospirillum oryzae TaxID=478448 RepID=A0A512HAR7_9PROT|nr:thioredoxin family protein [Pararhodospirillum oryzae]GEO82553.1 glutaredoxin [Pararhodospirillum oryzae]